MEGVIQYGEIAMSKGGANSPMITMALANAYSLKGDFSKGLGLYQKSIDNSTNERKALVYINRAFAYSKANLFNEAAKDYTKVMELEKGEINKYLPLRAYANLRANKFKEAYDDYSGVIKNEVAIDTTYNCRAVASFNLGNKEAAVINLKMAIKLNPNYKEALVNLEKLGIKK